MGQVLRRQFLMAASALLASPLAQARKFARPFRIGFSSTLRPKQRLGWIKLMSDVGLTHERDYTLIESGLPYGSQIDEAARRIVAQKPDVIVARSTSSALALHRLDKTTPIVMFTSGYPVAAGLARSLAHPGMNVTGNSSYAGTGIWGKMFQLLQEVKPGVKRIGLLWDYLPPAFAHGEIEFGMKRLRADARLLDVETQFAEVRRPEEAEPGLNALVASGVQALLVSRGPMLLPQFPRMIELASAARLPTITDGPSPASKMGPLLAYGPVQSELWHQTVNYVDRILKGAEPGDLPIQHPARFELVVSQRTAKAIGLTIPPSILLRADKVIE